MNCTKDQDALSISLTSKENRVKALESQLQEAEIRVEHATKARAKEIEALNVLLKGKEEAVIALQGHIDEELKQSTVRNETIRVLTEKVANCEGEKGEEQEKRTSADPGTFKTTASSPTTSDSAYYDGSEFYYQPSELRSYSPFPPRKRI